MRGDVVDEVMRTSRWKSRTSNSVPTEPAPFQFLLTSRDNRLVSQKCDEGNGCLSRRAAATRHLILDVLLVVAITSISESLSPVMPPCRQQAAPREVSSTCGERSPCPAPERDFLSNLFK